MMPWAQMLRAALKLGLVPGAFWRLSLKEWRMLLGGGEAGLSKEGLGALMAAFPDRDVNHDG